MNATILASFVTMTLSLVSIVADAPPFVFIGYSIISLALLALAIVQLIKD
jgi:hypothetical protein